MLQIKLQLHEITLLQNMLCKQFSANNTSAVHFDCLSSQDIRKKQISLAKTEVPCYPVDMFALRRPAQCFSWWVIYYTTRNATSALFGKTVFAYPYKNWGCFPPVSRVIANSFRSNKGTQSKLSDFS